MNPYAILAVVLIWMGSLTGVGYWQNDAGHTAERVTWQAKDNKELTDANAQILVLENAYRAAEKLHAANMAGIATKYEKEKQDAKTHTDALMSGLHDGSVRLFDPGAPGMQTDCRGSAQAAPASGRCNGGTHAELSAEAAGFLLRLTGESDEVVHQLEACQKIILEDRSDARPRP